MIDTKALRNKILDLAISGKLTEQLPEDGNAEDLYAQIQEEKARLIAEGKIKKEKPLPPITEEEIPFEIPENWKWVRIGELSWNHGQTIPKETFSYIDVGTLDNINHKLSDSENIIEAKNAPSRARKKVEYGDVLYSTVRPYLHNICVINKEFSKEPIASTAFCVMCVSNSLMVNYYLFYCLLSSYFDKYANGDPSKGTLYPAIGEKDFLNGLIPLPPLAEQKRIVSAVEDAFAVIDRIEKAQESYFADQEVLKNKIIDAGIRGKLTEQLPEDGNAEDLYAHIQEERARLIAEGKIKKEKPLPPITEEEIPFEIPENWRWVRLGDIVSVYGGKRIPAGRQLTEEDTGQKYIRISDMKNGSCNTGNLLYVPRDIIPSISKYKINKEDVYITVAGTIGKVGKIPKILDGANLTENADKLVFSIISQDWLIFCLSGDMIQKQIAKLTTQVAQPKLAIKRIQEFTIPLPPVTEQKRIAEKIDNVLDLI